MTTTICERAKNNGHKIRFEDFASLKAGDQFYYIDAPNPLLKVENWGTLWNAVNIDTGATWRVQDSDPVHLITGQCDTCREAVKNPKGFKSVIVKDIRARSSSCIEAFLIGMDPDDIWLYPTNNNIQVVMNIVNGDSVSIYPFKDVDGEDIIDMNTQVNIPRERDTVVEVEPITLADKKDKMNSSSQPSRNYNLNRGLDCYTAEFERQLDELISKYGVAQETESFNTEGHSQCTGCGGWFKSERDDVFWYGIATHDNDLHDICKDCFENSVVEVVEVKGLHNDDSYWNSDFMAVNPLPYA